MKQYLLTLLLITGYLTPAFAEVTSSSEHAFTVEHTVALKALPKEAFAAVTNEVANWWHPDHTWSGNAGQLYIEPRAGGCFCERLDNGGSAMHMLVSYVQPSSELRMVGGLGPLQGLGLNGAMSWVFKAAEGGSELSFVYRVHGVTDDGLQSLAPVVDGVLAVQLKRLAEFVNQSETP